MKRKGFTLAEVLVTLGILGVIAALTLPSLTKTKSDSGAGPLLAKAMASVEDAIGRVILEDPYTPLAKYFDGESGLDFNSQLSKHLVMKSTTGGYRLKDGVVINFVEPDANSSVGSLGTILKDVTVDINGTKLPNTTGVDKFRFALSSQGLLIPQGHAAKIASNNWKIPKDYDDRDWSEFKLGEKVECNKTCGTNETLDAIACMCVPNGTPPTPPGPSDPCDGVTCGNCQTCNEGSCVADASQNGVYIATCQYCQDGSVKTDTTSEDCQINHCEGKTWHQTCQTCDPATGNITAANDGTSLGNCKKCENGQEVDDTTSEGCAPDLCEGKTWHETCQTCDPATGNISAANEGVLLGNCQKCQGGSSVSACADGESCVSGVCKKDTNINIDYPYLKNYYCYGNEACITNRTVSSHELSSELNDGVIYDSIKQEFSEIEANWPEDGSVEDFDTWFKRRYNDGINSVEKSAQQQEKAPGNEGGTEFQSYLWEFIDYMQQVGYDAVDSLNSGDYSGL